MSINLLLCGRKIGPNYDYPGSCSMSVFDGQFGWTIKPSEICLHLESSGNLPEVYYGDEGGKRDIIEQNKKANFDETISTFWL